MTQSPTQSDNLNELFSALSKAQSKIEGAIKDKKNPFFKSTYADLNSVWEACRGPLTENNLSILQTIEGTKESMVLVTWIGHSSGQFIRSFLPLMIQKQDPQSVGSAITYARRYALGALVGICSEEDDDGEKAMNRNSTKVEPVRKVTTDIKIVDPEEDNLHITQFIRLIPEPDQQLAKGYLEAVRSAKNWSVKETVEYFKKDMENFKLKFNTWKENEKKKSNAA